MIIGENPWLLSQVHYIMPASQSASRPPSTLCYVSPLWQPAVIFFISPAELHNVNHTKYIHYIHHVCFHTKRSLLPATSPSVQSCGDKRGTAENHLEPEGMGQCRSLRYRRQQCAYSQFVPLLSAEALAADQWQLQSVQAIPWSGQS